MPEDARPSSAKGEPGMPPARCPWEAACKGRGAPQPGAGGACGDSAAAAAALGMPLAGSVLGRQRGATSGRSCPPDLAGRGLSPGQPWELPPARQGGGSDLASPFS